MEAELEAGQVMYLEPVKHTTEITEAQYSSLNLNLAWVIALASSSGCFDPKSNLSSLLR